MFFPGYFGVRISLLQELEPSNEAMTSYLVHISLIEQLSGMVCKNYNLSLCKCFVSQYLSSLLILEPICNTFNWNSLYFLEF